MSDRRSLRRQTAPVALSSSLVPLGVQTTHHKLELPTAVAVPSPQYAEARQTFEAALTSSDIFFALPPAEYERLYSCLGYFELMPNQLVFKEKFPGSAFFILHTGEVRLTSNKKLISFVGPGTCFGSLCLRFGCPRFLTAFTVKQTHVWVMGADDFRQFERIARQVTLPALETTFDTHTCLRTLRKNMRRAFLDTCAVHSFRKGQQILVEGALGGLIFFLMSGTVSVWKEGARLWTLHTGDLFGEQSALYANECVATVIAESDCMCLSLDKGHLQVIFGLSLSHFIYRNSVRLAFDQSCCASQLSAEQKEALLEVVTVSTYAYDEVVISAGTSFGEGFWIVLQGSLVARDGLESTDNSALAEVYDCINDDILVEKESVGGFMQDIVANSDEVAIGEVRQQDIERCLGADFRLRLNPSAQCCEMLRDVGFVSNLCQRKQAVFCRFAQVHNLQQGQRVPSEVHTQALCLLQQGEVELDGAGTVFVAPQYFGAGSKSSTHSAMRLVARTDVVLVTLNKRYFKSVFGLLSHQLIQQLLDTKPKPKLRLEDLTIIRRYEKLKIGSIFLATDAVGKQYGLKRVCRQKVKSLFLGRKLHAERDILGLLAHPLVPRLVGTFMDAHYLYFLKEFVPGVILADLLPTAVGMEEAQIREYVAMSISILEHLHNFDILHRDISPESFLIDSEGYLHLIDLGSAVIAHERAYTVIGSPQYVAPELLRDEGAGKAADLWSLGVMVFELIYGRVPYGESEEDPYLVFRAIAEDPEVRINDSRLSRECCDFVNSLLARDETQRGTAISAKNDPWLRDFDWVSTTQNNIAERRLQLGLQRLVQVADVSTRLRRRWPFEHSATASPFRNKVVPTSDDWVDGF